MNAQLSPIVLFAFVRPDHLRRTLEALRRNALAGQSDLLIYADAAAREDERPSVERVREVARRATGYRSVTLVERPSHFGLARNIIEGVTEVSARSGRVIVLEDDMVTSPWFLTYMNQALDRYESDDRVASIHGYLYPVHARLPETFFLRGSNCWGWGTWHRAWRVFNPDGAFLLGEVRRRALTSLFDFGDTFGYTRLLEGQIAGTNDSWALRWYASAFLENMLTLYPGRSLVHNIGHDGSGHHRTRSRSFDVQVSHTPIQVGDCPIEDSDVGRAAFEAYFHSQRARFVRLRTFLRERSPSVLLEMARRVRGRDETRPSRHV